MTLPIENVRRQLLQHRVSLAKNAQGGLRYEAPGPVPPHLVEAMRDHKAALLAELEAGTVPALPDPVGRLVAAAASGKVGGPARLESGNVTDLGTYVLAWAAAYLTNSPDRFHALARLQEVCAVWGAA